MFEDKFKVDEETGCWNWIASLDRHGYGQVMIKQRLNRAHRAVYQDRVGPIPARMVLDHKCGNPRCVNPDHLEPVTQGENLRRSAVTLPSLNAAKTHCPQGHSYAEHGEFSPHTNGRFCRMCKRASDTRYREKKRQCQ